MLFVFPWLIFLSLCCINVRQVHQLYVSHTAYINHMLVIYQSYISYLMLTLEGTSSILINSPYIMWRYLDHLLKWQILLIVPIKVSVLVRT